MGATRRIKRYARGTDTVPAMLTPHEAVLNPNAAELIGRDLIKRANAHGNRLAKRGIDLASDPAAYPPGQNLEGFERGTNDVMDHEDQGESMMKVGVRFTPEDLDKMQKMRMAEAEIRRRQAMNEMPQQVFGFAGGTDDVRDLLRETENTFYGGGHAMPRPTPKPTPTPRFYAYGTPDVNYDGTDPLGPGTFSPSNATSRIRKRSMGGGLLNVTEDSPVSASRYIGAGGVDLGEQYDPWGRVNPLPKGAVGVQGYQNVPSQQSYSAPAPAMTHTQMAEDIARRNLTAAGSSLGTPTQDVPPGWQKNVSPEEAAAKGLQWTGGSTGWQPYVSPEQATQQNLQYSGGNPVLQLANQMANDRQQAAQDAAQNNAVGVSQSQLSASGIRPGRYADAASPITQSGTGYSFMTGRGSRVDIAGPPPPQPRRNGGYGSAYGY